MMQRQQNSCPLRRVEPFDGVLVVDKPSGPTSHDIVDTIRRSFGFRKVGHGGTLDPRATGVLIILIGKATKLSNRFIGSDKMYEGTIRLGIATDSHDADGRIVREADYSMVTREQLEAEMKKLTGDTMQMPPMVSAIKVDGVPLYKSARKGREVKRDPRLIHVYQFSLLDFQLPLADFRVRCTKGTYVRTLCADIGEALGCGAHLDRLRRTSSGDISIENATPIGEILKMEHDALIEKVVPLGNFSGHEAPGV